MLGERRTPAERVDSRSYFRHTRSDRDLVGGHHVAARRCDRYGHARGRRYWLQTATFSETQGPGRNSDHWIRPARERRWDAERPARFLLASAMIWAGSRR